MRLAAKEWPSSVATPGEAWHTLPICGCGDPEAAIEVTHWILASWCPEYHEGVDWDVYYANIKQFHEYLGDAHEGMYWLALYALDKFGLAEHGGGIQSSWLEPKGDRVLAFLDAFGDDPDGWPEEHVEESGSWFELTDEQGKALVLTGRRFAALRSDRQ